MVMPKSYDSRGDIIGMKTISGFHGVASAFKNLSIDASFTTVGLISMKGNFVSQKHFSTDKKHKIEFRPFSKIRIFINF